MSSFLMSSPSRRRWIPWIASGCRSRSKPAQWRLFKQEMSIDDDDSSRGRRVLLVYELMHNVSLQDVLLDKSRCFSMALDIACGLQFLHSICDLQVIHGDIKPSIVLLAANLSSRIADFNLARFKSTIGNELQQRDDEDAVEKPKEIKDDASVITFESLVTTAAKPETYDKTKTQEQEEDERFSRVEDNDEDGTRSQTRRERQSTKVTRFSDFIME